MTTKQHDSPRSPKPSALGIRMRTLREARGMSLDDVSRSSGIFKANLSRIENGWNRNPTRDTLERIAGAIGCEVRDFG